MPMMGRAGAVSRPAVQSDDLTCPQSDVGESKDRVDHDSGVCELRGDNRRLIRVLVAFVVISAALAIVVSTQGFVTFSDAVVVAGLVLMGVAALVGAYFNRRYRVVLSPERLTVDHPWEGFSVDWANVIEVVPVYYGIMEVRVRDESAVAIRNSAFVRWFKRQSGQPLLTFSTRPLAGGERRFIHCLEMARGPSEP